MRLLYGYNEIVGQFVSNLIWKKPDLFDDRARAIGVINNSGELVGGMVFTEYNPHAMTMEVSGASISPRWLTRRIISDLLAYPFEQCNCQMITGRTRVTNYRTRKLLSAIGVREQFVERLFGRHQDGFLLTLTDDAWRNGRFAREND